MEFSAMGNFVYMPLKRLEGEPGSKPQYRSLLEELRIPGFVSSSWLQQPCELFIPPPIYSRIDLPQKYYFKESVARHDGPKELDGKAVIAQGKIR